MIISDEKHRGLYAPGNIKEVNQRRAGSVLGWVTGVCRRVNHLGM